MFDKAAICAVEHEEEDSKPKLTINGTEYEFINNLIYKEVVFSNNFQWRFKNGVWSYRDMANNPGVSMRPNSAMKLVLAESVFFSDMFPTECVFYISSSQV